MTSHNLENLANAHFLGTEIETAIFGRVVPGYFSCTSYISK